jgi:hypothetical protein
MNWELLLTKYVAYIAAAEGEYFALSVNSAPCDMLDMEFTDDEKAMLSEVFKAVRRTRERVYEA